MKVVKQILKSTAMLSMMTASALTFAANATGDLSSFTSAQQTQIKDYVNKSVPQVIMSKPKVVLDAVKKYQQQQQQQQIQKAKQVILAKINDFVRNPNTPTYNPNGKLTLVEFFDYQCSVCHMMYPIINAVAKANPNLRVVYKDLPIFGPASNYAAKGSFAAYQQSPKLYLAYHDGLFTSGKMEGKMTDADVDAVAKKVGLNMDKFHKAIKSQQVQAELNNNLQLAQALQLTGTPALIIAPSTATSGMSLNKVGFIPGGARPEQLQAAINGVEQAVAK